MGQEEPHTDLPRSHLHLQRNGEGGREIREERGVREGGREREREHVSE